MERAAYMPGRKKVRLHDRLVRVPRIVALLRDPGFGFAPTDHRSPLDCVLFLLVAVSLLSAGVFASSYEGGYNVTVDGVAVGNVLDSHEVEDAVSRVESRASQILDRTYTLPVSVETEYCLMSRNSDVPVASVETYLFDQIGEVMKTSVLTVNGRVIGATDNDAALRAALEELKAPYINENTIYSAFDGTVSVSREYTATSALRDVEAMKRDLSVNTMEQLNYTVVAGDTFSAIANNNGMSVSQLAMLNPSFADEKAMNSLHIGDELVVRCAVPYLPVRTVDHLIYEGGKPFETETRDNDSMYKGDSRVITAGVEGTALYDANVTYVNGKEQERVINSEVVLTEPVTEVVEVGTKARPKTMATGHFQWPIRGSISSSYGSRYIFGSYSFHSGLDITGSYGASIKASDGGKVIFAGTGTGSNWSLGNYVVIDHENGFRTYYCHCSSLDVKVGQRVYQGQTIARVGKSGRATGSHCHFTLKKNGSTVNPLDYLP